AIQHTQSPRIAFLGTNCPSVWDRLSFRILSAWSRRRYDVAGNSAEVWVTEAFRGEYRVPLTHPHPSELAFLRSANKCRKSVYTTSIRRGLRISTFDPGRGSSLVSAPISSALRPCRTPANPMPAGPRWAP
ncbi:unnamed protein product, partial [Ixodes persulcatus]